MIIITHQDPTHARTTSPRRLPLPSRPRPLPRPINRQPIRLHIPRMIRMSLNPLKTRLNPQSVPLLNLTKHILHNILILHRLSSRRLPPIPPPIHEPIRNAIDGVFGVGDDDDAAVAGGDLESAQDGG